MATMIRPNRLEVSDRFPVAGFTIKTGSTPWFEVALATDPVLFRSERKSQRNSSNFYSSRAAGPLLAERGEAVYLVPPEVLRRFAGQPKLYFGLATFADANRSRAGMLQIPSEGSPWLNLGLFTGRGSRRMTALPPPRNSHARHGNGYAAISSEELVWAGDAAQPGTATIAAPPPPNGSTTAPASPIPNSPATPPNTSASVALGYDDGFDSALWSKPLVYNVVHPEYTPRNFQEAWQWLKEFLTRRQRWSAGVSDTSFFPHSAICRFRIFRPAGEYIGTGFYIGQNRILTCAHNLAGANSITIIPGKNGSSEPFGSFPVNPSSWFVHPQYNPNSRDFDLGVIIVNTPPPHGQYFDILEELNQSIEEPIVVCGYAAETVNPDIQHLDGDTIRTLGPNAETFQYSIQTEGGSSGSPVFFVWARNDEERQMTVQETSIIGVHTSIAVEPATGNVSDNLNEGCRLTESKIQWIYSVGNTASTKGFSSRNGRGLTTGRAPAPRATPFSNDIPLDPGNGGRSIGVEALQIGDIIVSTTDAWISEAIRSASGSPVSHAMIYTGDGGQVVEAIGDGVVFRPLSEALAGATVAVAFRHPNLTEEQAWRIRDFVGQQIGKNYNYWGIIRQAGFQLDRRVFCSGKTGDEYQRCVDWVGRINLGTGTNDQFFCSQLVVAAYEQAGVPLTSTPPHWNSPGDIAELRLSGMLGYVGHLIAPPVSTSQGKRTASVARNGNGYSQSYNAPRSRAFSGQSFDVDWKEDIYLVPQLTGMSCWAASAAMVVGWRDLISINPEEIARGAGQWAAYTAGLNPNDVDELARAWGLQKEWPLCYTIEGFRELLESCGPLWIGMAVPSGHAVVVTGLYGNGTPEGTFVRYNDPWPVGQGRERQVKNYTQFMQEYENFASVDTAGNGNIQIIHANGRRPLSTSQGYATGYGTRNGKRSPSTRARSFSGEAATNSALSIKEADYSEEIGEAAEPEQDVMAAGERAALTNEEIYRIIREVALVDSGDALYSAVSTNQSNQFGLAFGLVLFTQHSGRLGRVLQLMQRRDAAIFAEIFGPEAEALLTVTNAATPAARLQPVGGEPLWSAAWIEKFRRAGEVQAFQAAQNEEAIEGLFRPLLKTAGRLGLSSDRGLAMAFDRVVTRGLGGGLRWLVQAAGVLRTAAQRQHALQMLGYENLAQFQATAGDLPQSGIFGPETHAALIAALRQQGAATLPSPEELVCRLVAVAQGAAKKRLMRLRDSGNLMDVVYNI